MKKKTFIVVLAIVILAVALSCNCYAAGDIASSQLGKGISSMLDDVSTWLIIICPVAGGLAAVYFIIRRSMADDQDGKIWERRIKTAIVCGVAGVLVSGVIKLISSYFS